MNNFSRVKKAPANDGHIKKKIQPTLNHEKTRKNAKNSSFLAAKKYRRDPQVRWYVEMNPERHKNKWWKELSRDFSGFFLNHD